MIPSLAHTIADLSERGLNLLAEELSLGYSVGRNRSDRKGPGIEFVGHRPYLPGDDLRHLDRHALLRRGVHLMREFRTETERPTYLVVDISASMDYGETATLPSKKAFAVVLAAALLKGLKGSGDPLGLVLWGRGRTEFFPARRSQENTARLMTRLSLLLSSKVLPSDPESVDQDELPRELSRTEDRSSSIILSDGLDVSPDLITRCAPLFLGRRNASLVQVLTHTELTFPFQGSLALRGSETGQLLITEAQEARASYQKRLSELMEHLRHEVVGRGGRYLSLEVSGDFRAAFQRLMAGLEAPREAE